MLCRFVVEDVIAPVDHRQLVFVLPKMLRSAFHRDRELLRGLCRAAVDTTQAFYRAGLDRKELSVGMMVVPQFFGDRLTPHLHLHALASDGAFDPEGQFHRMPFDMQHDTTLLRRLFERRVLDLMVKHKRLSEQLRDDILGWEHTGFSVDGSVRVLAGDHPKLLRLVRYIARPAVSFERVSYDDSTGNVTVRSAKKVAEVRPVVAQYDVLTFIALLTLQVPPPGTHMVRYYGWYSNRSRAARQEDADAPAGSSPPKEVQPPEAKERRRRWAELIRKV